MWKSLAGRSYYKMWAGLNGFHDGTHSDPPTALSHLTHSDPPTFCNTNVLQSYVGVKDAEASHKDALAPPKIPSAFLKPFSLGAELHLQLQQADKSREYRMREL